MGKKKSLQFLDGVTTDSPNGDDLVVGPTSSTDNRVVRFDGTEGDIQGTGVTVDDSENVTGVNDLTTDGDVSVGGDLDVVNSITVNSGGDQSSADDTAGITVEMSDATDAKIIYDKDVTSKFKAGEAGSESEIIVATGSQTLDSKTLEFLNTSSASAAISSAELTATKGLMLITSGENTLDTITYGSVDTGTHLTVLNTEGADIVVTNDDNIITGTGTNYKLKNTAAATFVYNGTAWVLSGGAGGGGLELSSISTATTAVMGTHYLTDTTSAAFTVTLPAGEEGAIIRFTDATSKWNVNALTLTPASGETINGYSTDESLVCDVAGAFVQLSWDNSLSVWVVDSNSAAVDLLEATSTTLGTVKKNKWQRKDLTSNFTTASSAFITFNNLVVGKTYELSGQVGMYVNVGAADVAADFNIEHDGNQLASTTQMSRQTDSTSGELLTSPISVIFTATATTVTLESSSSIGANSYIAGDASYKRTFAILTERNDLEAETTDFT